MNDMELIEQAHEQMTKDEINTVTKIADRIIKEFNNGEYDDMLWMNVADAICMVHVFNIKLRLSDWLNADSFNFVHDLNGITENFNFETGKLEGCFLPRFTK